MKVKGWKPLVLLFIVIFVLSAVNDVHALGVTATIPVGNGPASLAYDSAKGEVFVPNSLDNTTSVISDSTNTVVAIIPVGGFPDGAAYDSRLGEIFVVNMHSNTVSVISDSTNAVVVTIPVGESPQLIAYDSGKGELFVTNSYDGTVSVISDSTNTVVATVPVGIEPFAVAYDSGKGEIFVVNRPPDNNTLSVISDSTNAVVATVTLHVYPAFLAYDSGKGEIFLTNNGTDLGFSAVTVISDSTNEVVATVERLDDINIAGAVYDSGRGDIFVAYHETNKVAVISDTTNAVVETISVGNMPWAPAYDSGKSEIFVNNGGSNTVSVISDASSTSTSPGSGSFVFGTVDWIIVIIVIIVLLILIILVWYSRQRKLIVAVQNSQTLSPISGANVSVSGPRDLSGTTDSNGQIVFSNLKKGDYSIKASATGYNTSMPLSVSVKNKTDCVIKLNPASAGWPKDDNSKSGSEDEGKASSKNSNVVAQEPNNQTQPTQTLQQAPVQSATDTAQTTPPPPLTEQQGWSGERIRQTIKTFQEKGAISPETALTAKELGLSRIFVRIMERRKEQTKIFVEVNGKYYLDQQALEEKKQ